MEKLLHTWDVIEAECEVLAIVPDSQVLGTPVAGHVSVEVEICCHSSFLGNKKNKTGDEEEECTKIRHCRSSSSSSVEMAEAMNASVYIGFFEVCNASKEQSMIMKTCSPQHVWPLFFPSYVWSNTGIGFRELCPPLMPLDFIMHLADI